MAKCVFYECRNLVEPGRTKCIVHRHRSQCTAPFCRNQAYARGRCVRHGARKHCLMPGCTHYRRSGGHCARHGTLLRKQMQDANGELATSLEPLAFVPADDAACDLALNVDEWATLQTLLHDPHHVHFQAAVSDTSNDQ
ncbi:Aste57867_1527 [Aphanomyces stellatus]|uniref:Aste57867_1527 protein n=1 Tax=Aphanomyces stellatus TaxID=120398 RepID=A0A485K8V0_9STRA|nr:hypothetical protein As57867_001526 [Aphanomyces stellatus]VFT78742.1 Aste57867_1527 [Aphanomyces stellatus]